MKVHADVTKSNQLNNSDEKGQPVEASMGSAPESTSVNGPASSSTQYKKETDSSRPEVVVVACDVNSQMEADTSNTADSSSRSGDHCSEGTGCATVLGGKGDIEAGDQGEGG